MKNATDAPVELESRIAAVTVYLSGAQITRTATIPPGAGVQRLAFTGLPADVQPDSIQAGAPDAVLIHSVEHTVDHLSPAPRTEAITALQSTLKDLRRQRAEQVDAAHLADLEESFFTGNTPVGGKTGLKPDELKAVAGFYAERMAAVYAARRAAGERRDDLDRQIAATEAQLGVFKKDAPDPQSRIVVTVSTDGGTSGGALTVSYYVPTASWRPSYDLRIEAAGGPVRLHHKAHVTQTTGENWADVQLALSTGNPALNGRRPELDPWYLDLPTVVMRGAVPAPMVPMAPMAMAAMASADMAMGGAEDALAMKRRAPAVTTAESVTSVSYTIPVPYSVASGDEGQDVEVAVHDLAAAYRYVAIPKLDPAAYLVAGVTAWELINLVPGPASVFFGSQFVGTTWIDPRDGEETLDLTVGPDPGVAVTRERGRDYTAKTLTGTSVRRTRQWDLTVRNLKPTAVDVELVDQVPVSANKQIAVEVPDSSGAVLDADTGRVTWRFRLDPAGARTVTLRYQVTAPTTSHVILE